MKSTRTLTHIALMTTLIVVLGFMPAIPLGFIPVPIVLQNMGIMMVAMLLGGRKGSLAVLLFLLIGLLVPVFTGGSTTISVMVGPTAGYVVAWLVVPLAYSGLKGLLGKENFPLTFINIFLAGVVLVDVLGAVYLSYYTEAPLVEMLLSNLIFIPGDTIKAIVATVISSRLLKLPYFKD
ncbi:biotin transporter BioY [Streptococcus caprae]|uniref:Biotin transporter n=1 Tax=Streptococcus caprae TaxID=1640501 RepID=A0ABV8CVA2_9STRE